jgi:MinD-like ATPase involved in chromosome partitioning or flagellar assembly
MGTICTVAIHKGGTGKTTVSAHVAVLPSEQGSKTLPVDLEWRHNPNRRLAFLNDRLYI